MASAWATIDLDAVKGNVAALVEMVAPAEVCAVVKADGYGHGAVPVARAAVDAGATWLAVAHVGEGEALRAGGLEVPILVLSEPDPNLLSHAADLGLQVTLFSEPGVRAAAAAASQARPVGVHLKVDTGMHRVGVDPSAVVPLAQRVIDAPGLELEALWTHLAVADEPDHDFTAVQLDRYQGALEQLEAAGISPRLRHAANSAGAIAHPASRFDLVRCGIAIYGISPSPELAGHAPLHPAMSLSARVTQVKVVPAGDALSYGLRHRFDVPTVVATVAIGYADGVRRDLHRLGGEVLLGGHRCPIVGTITMDQLMVDCGDVEVAAGDEAVLIGSQGPERITAEAVAGRLDTIGYEVVCGVGPRVERRWTGC
ncbi:MAG: alanine racemase [Acidimicrobiales bacterium]|nr:alanine racemase [Acidimicrobiales bacterium]